MENLFVLGAASIEMVAIERLLKECGLPVIYACEKHNAFLRRAKESHLATDAPFPNENIQRVFLIGCDIPTPKGAERILIQKINDEHMSFMCASMMGQVLSILTKLDLPKSFHEQNWKGKEQKSRPIGTISRESQVWLLTVSEYENRRKKANGEEYFTGYAYVIPEDFVYAATDQFLLAAYQDECPGVDSTSLKIWRYIELAKLIGCSAAQVKHYIQEIMLMLRKKYDVIQIGSTNRISVKDWRYWHTIDRVELAEAIARDQSCVLLEKWARRPDTNEFDYVTMCRGTKTEHFQAFAEWAHNNSMKVYHTDMNVGVALAYGKKKKRKKNKGRRRKNNAAIAA